MLIIVCVSRVLLCDPKERKAVKAPWERKLTDLWASSQSPKQNLKRNSPEKTFSDAEKNQCGKMSKGKEDRPGVLWLILFGGTIQNIRPRKNFIKAVFLGALLLSFTKNHHLIQMLSILKDFQR